MADTNPEEKFWDLIDDIQVAMLTAKRGDKLESRPMSAYVDRAERAIFFLTKLESEKTHEIEADEEVNLAFVDNDDRTYVSVTGHARVERNVEKQKQLWGPFAEAWMPEGPEAPSTGLIRVHPTEATYWDSPSSDALQLFRVAVSNITQTPPPGDEVKKVQFG